MLAVKIQLDIKTDMNIHIYIFFLNSLVGVDVSSRGIT